MGGANGSGVPGWVDSPVRMIWVDEAHLRLDWVPGSELPPREAAKGPGIVDSGHRPDRAGRSDLELDVTACLSRIQKGDQDAARSLVEHLFPTVIKIVRKNLPRRILEEDLAQEIFAKMFEKLEFFRGDVPLEHWVSRIAVNHCLNAIRSQRVRPEWRMADFSEEQAAAIEAVTAGPTSDLTPAQSMGARELVDLLLNSLEPEDRLLIQMLEVEELPVEEVRAVTGWSVPYIRVRAFRARRKLNRRFGALRKKGML